MDDCSNSWEDSLSSYSQWFNTSSLWHLSLVSFTFYHSQTSIAFFTTEFCSLCSMYLNPLPFNLSLEINPFIFCFSVHSMLHIFFIVKSTRFTIKMYIYKARSSRHINCTGFRGFVLFFSESIQQLMRACRDECVHVLWLHHYDKNSLTLHCHMRGLVWSGIFPLLETETVLQHQMQYCFWIVSSHTYKFPLANNHLHYLSVGNAQSEIHGQLRVLSCREEIKNICDSI